jgi:hypothetical protein
MKSAAREQGAEHDWVDRLAVEGLIHRYASAVTRADWDDVEAVFAPDAVVEISSPYDIRLEGARAIREFLVEATAGSELLIQTAHSTVVRLEDQQRASAVSIIHELSRGNVGVTTSFAAAGTAVNYESYGIYHDDAVRLGDSWSFARRFFRPLYIAPNSLLGHVLAPRSTLRGRPSSS